MARTPLRILVIEDHRDTAHSLSVLLRIWGHNPLLTFDGTAALEVAPRFRPDVILLDIGLPQLDGYQVARRLRQQPAGRDASVVVVSGYGQEMDRQRALEAGADVFLLKPVDPPFLRDLLTQTGGRKHAVNDPNHAVSGLDHEQERSRSVPNGPGRSETQALRTE